MSRSHAARKRDGRAAIERRRDDHVRRYAAHWARWAATSRRLASWQLGTPRGDARRTSCGDRWPPSNSAAFSPSRSFRNRERNRRNRGSRRFRGKTVSLRDYLRATSVLQAVRCWGASLDSVGGCSLRTIFLDEGGLVYWVNSNAHDSLIEWLKLLRSEMVRELLNHKQKRKSAPFGDTKFYNRGTLRPRSH